MIPKFRAWDKKEKRMLSVRALQWDRVSKGNSLITVLADDGSKKPTTAFTNEKYDFKSKDLVETKLENCILMQSTGLKDKNDKEIFEGDVIEYDTVDDDMKHIKERWLIEFDENIDTDGTYGDTTGWHLPVKREWCVVIGNIWETPELMEDK